MVNNIHAVLGLFVKDGKILSVTRRDNYDDWGLPGGKLEENETPEQCLIREFREETGLEIKNYSPKVFFYRNAERHPDKLILTYLISDAEGIITQEENGGKVDFINPEELMKGSYSQYNEELLNQLNHGLQAKNN